MSATARRLAILAALIFAVALARPASAEPLAILDGNHPDEASDLVGAAPASPVQPLAMRLTLALRNRAELSHLLASQQDPASPDYHRWLTPDDFNSRFGPTAADLARVSRFLTQKGFTVTSADASSREVNFTGTVAQAQNVFAVKIAATADGRLYSNTADPRIPASLAPLVDSIHGLDNLLHSAPTVRRVSSLPASANSPASIVNDTGPSFGPPDIYTFYDESPLLSAGTPIDGSGPGCIAVIEDSDLDEPAANSFNSAFSLPALTGANFSTVFPDGSDPGQTQNEDETMVDVVYSHALAPGSSIRAYVGDPRKGASAITDAIHAAVREKNSRCTAISISFGFCGGSKGFYKTQDSYFAQAAAQGQSVFVASGDQGAAGLKLNRNTNQCGPGSSRSINELAASPNVTAVGGTEFSPDYQAGVDDGFVAESVWNDGEGATGGGESKYFKKPAFQKGLIVADKKRDIPDISFGASPSTPGFFYGGRFKGAPTVLCCIGGTSIGAPAWAGISQLITQASGTPVGNLNTRLYQLGAQSSSANGIRDVTAGDNSFGRVHGFPATVGYDKSTGWGTVDIGLFVPAYMGM